MINALPAAATEPPTTIDTAPPTPPVAAIVPITMLPAEPPVALPVVMLIPPDPDTDEDAPLATIT